MSQVQTSDKHRSDQDPAIPLTNLHDEDRVARPITVSIKEAVRISGLSRTKIYQLLDGGRIRSSRIGGRRLIFLQSLERLLAENEV